MAVGSVAGTVVSTEELKRGMVVVVDHERYTVDRVTVERHNGVAMVDLVAEREVPYPLAAEQVDMNDWHEPMWELA
jgi:hypothetical protein